MPAARDTDWTHVHVVGGDRAAAAPYLSYARKLLGFVKQDAANNRLLTHQATKQLPDGALVAAEIRGGIPRITITPPRVTGGEPLQGLDRFVVIARADGQFAGIDADHPEQWLDVPGVTRKVGWLTRFFSEEIPAFAAFVGEKGTYAALRGRGAFPDGVLHYGNLDHRSATGYRISWYGPSGRSFNDAWVNPGVVYRQQVFLLGEVLLDTATYDDDSTEQADVAERVIYGAGVAGGHLYTIQGPGLTAPPAPSWPADGTGHIVSAVLRGGVDGPLLRLFRYALGAHDAPGQVRRLRVVPNSREELWSGDWTGRDCQPWHFNPKCTEATSFSAGINIAIARRVDIDPPSFEFTDTLGGGGTPVPPSPTDERFTLTIAEEAADLTVEAVTLPAVPSDASAVLGRDYDEDGGRIELRVARRTIASAAGTLCFELDGQRWPLQEEAGGDSVTRRYLLHADLPQRTLVFAVCSFDYDPPGDGGWAYAVTGGSVVVEVWRRGARVGQVPVSAAALATGRQHAAPYTQAARGYTLWEILGSVALAPSFALYGIVQLESDTREDFHDSENVTQVTIAAVGGAAMFAYTAYPDAFNFGYYRLVGSATTLKWGTDRTGLYDHEVDRDSSYTPFAAATLGDHTIVSGYPLLPGDELATFTWTDTDTTLPALTGVAGAYQRYHPLWRLGRFDLPAL